MKLLLLPLLLVVCGFGSCQSKPNVPETVTVVVEKYKDLPTWATEQLVKPQAVNGTVGARLTNEDQRGNTIDLANCHRRLLTKLDKGEAVKPEECE